MNWDVYTNIVRREVRQLMHLRHPNILSFYGTMTHGNTLAIVTELMDGES